MPLPHLPSAGTLGVHGPLNFQPALHTLQASTYYWGRVSKSGNSWFTVLREVSWQSVQFFLVKPVPSTMPPWLTLWCKRENKRMCTAVQSFHGCHRRKYRELGNAQQSFGSLVLFFFQCLALKIKFLLYNISQPQSLGLSHTPASQPQGSWEYKCQYAKIKPQLRYNDDCPSLPLSTEGNKKEGGKHRGQAETICENTMWQIQGFKKVQHGPTGEQVGAQGEAERMLGIRGGGQR